MSVDDDQVYRTVVIAKNVGKTIASTKKMVQWGLFCGGQEHVIMLKHSVMSGKKVIFLDKALIYETKEGGLPFKHKFSIGKQDAIVNVDKDNQGYFYLLEVDEDVYQDLPHLTREAILNYSKDQSKKDKKDHKDKDKKDKKDKDKKDKDKKDKEKKDKEKDKDKKDKEKDKKDKKKKDNDDGFGGNSGFDNSSGFNNNSGFGQSGFTDNSASLFELDAGETLKDESIESMLDKLTLRVDTSTNFNSVPNPTPPVGIPQNQKKDSGLDLDGLINFNDFSSKHSGPAKKVGGDIARPNLVKPVPTAQYFAQAYQAPKTVDEFGFPINPQNSDKLLDAAFGVPTQGMGMGMGMQGNMNRMGGGGFGGYPQQQQPNNPYGYGGNKPTNNNNAFGFF